jgi:hypothetical protein
MPGLPGLDGIPGERGEVGIMGMPGMPGEKGKLGLDGLPGAKGVPGPAGPKGDPGWGNSDGCSGCRSECTRTIAFSANAFEVDQTSTDVIGVTFTQIVTNIGNAFDKSGQFTAPVGGAYFFHVTARANGNGATPLLFYRGNDIIMITGRSDADAVGPYSLGTNSIVVQLEAGDSVSLKVKPKSSGFFSGIINSVTSSKTDVSFVGYRIGGCLDEEQQQSLSEEVQTYSYV